MLHVIQEDSKATYTLITLWKL